MNAKNYTALACSVFGGLIVIFLLSAPPTGYDPDSPDGDKVVCDPALTAGPPRGDYELWDQDNGVLGDPVDTKNICDARRSQRLSWAMLIGLPTAVITTVTILRWPRRKEDRDIAHEDERGADQ